MPVVPSITKPLADLLDFNGVSIRQWIGLANGDTGAPVNLCRYNDKTIQFSGVFGVGGTVILEATVDGTTWSPMTDVFGTVISATTAKVLTITEVPLEIRPRVTAGDGSTAITVSLLVR